MTPLNEHRGSDHQAATSSEASSTWAHQERIVGAMALALAASMVIQNVVVGAAPAYWDPIADVFSYHVEHRTAVSIAVGLEALNLPLLLGFLTGLHGIVADRAGTPAHWSRLALAAGAAASAILALYAVLWIGVVLVAGELTAPNPAFQLTWQMHAAAFAFAMPALGTTFIGAAMAANASGLTPRWQRLLGLIGGVLLIATGTASLAIADGSALLFVGVPGYFAWIIWLATTGVRLGMSRPHRPQA